MGVFVQYEKDIGGLEDALLDKIGTDSLNTDAQNLSGAVNEINASAKNKADITYVDESIDTDEVSAIFSDMADAIRSKTGTSASIPASQMASMIENMGGDGGYIEAFKYANSNITSYTGSEQYILNNAFESCSNLSTVDMSDCKYIGSGAFMSCNHLSNISFPKCSFIGSATFSSCTSLSNVSFPNCSYISSYAFYGCNNLSIAAFPECEIIGFNAFENCTYLSNISFPKCTSIGWSAFSKCTQLSEAIFPECKEVGIGAFYRCTSLAFVSIPKCSRVRTITFYSCTSLTTISFPVCSYIDNYAFANCTLLSSLYLLNSSVATLANSNAFNYTPLSKNGTGKIYVPSSLYNNYITANNWSTLSARISSYNG
jgi:hypothetical protein